MGMLPKGGQPLEEGTGCRCRNVCYEIATDARVDLKDTHPAARDPLVVEVADARVALEERGHDSQLFGGDVLRGRVEGAHAGPDVGLHVELVGGARGFQHDAAVDEQRHGELLTARHELLQHPVWAEAAATPARTCDSPDVLLALHDVAAPAKVAARLLQDAGVGGLLGFLEVLGQVLVQPALTGEAPERGLVAQAVHHLSTRSEQQPATRPQLLLPPGDLQRHIVARGQEPTRVGRRGQDPSMAPPVDGVPRRAPQTLQLRVPALPRHDVEPDGLLL
eukprot:CAMPEP_0175545224 /NCGR_PEP_ID=MMETSP0096-20121207/29174_1 /TAXON_ID=311494 /ORGANISM="Alexandrium monilatum, Strain CCMP3105" /LENGTH=277 /DNA_ID=CAMNT_0016848185 /DNA_START=129 /DNA_END=959 /DNA_ORIENTATION=-